jgi:uncharacterized protein
VSPIPSPFAPADSAFDLHSAIARLFIYPVKSCAGIDVPAARLIETGLEWDRAWMVVDADGSFLTQREHPRMALVRPQLRSEDLVLRAPGMLALHVALDVVEAPAQVSLWGSAVAAFDMGGIAAQWFSDFLGVPARLVRFDPDFQRPSSRRWTGELQALNQFSDGYPLLLLSEASMADFNGKRADTGLLPVGIERFRPNIVLGGALPGRAGFAPHDEDRIGMLHLDAAGTPVALLPVKPCLRCPIPDIDPATGNAEPSVGELLRSYRQDARVGGANTFGMNAVAHSGLGALLQVGQPAGARWHFD